MKIVQSTSDVLVLSDSATPIRGVGAVFALVGSGFVYAGITQSAGGGVWVAATVSILIGLAMVILPGRVTAAFDRGSHTLIVTRRGLRKNTRDEVDFSKIAGVEAERSQMSGEQATFRVTVVLKDGYRLPLTSYYSNTGDQPAAAAAAASFLGLAAPPSAPQIVSEPQLLMSIQTQRRTGARYTAVIFALFFAAFIGIGGWFEYVQYTRLTTYRPASATVLTSTVTSHRGSKGGTTWSPAVTYRYTVGDHEYVGTQVTVIKESRSGQWAFKIAARYRAGDATTAWYDPDRPDQAFLVHEASWFPLMFIGIPIGILLVMLFVSRLRAANKLQPMFAPVLRK